MVKPSASQSLPPPTLTLNHTSSNHNTINCGSIHIIQCSTIQTSHTSYDSALDSSIESFAHNQYALETHSTSLLYDLPSLESTDSDSDLSTKCAAKLINNKKSRTRKKRN